MSKALATCLALLVTLGSSCLGSGNSVNAYAGTRSLDTSDFGSLDDQSAYGLDAVLKLNLPLLAVEGGWLHSDESDDSTAGLTDAQLQTDEYFVGLRFVPWDFLIEPYASAGVAYQESSLDATGVSDDDGSIGYYARIGAAISFGMFRFGLDGRALFGTDVNLDTISSDVNSYQIAAFVGLGF